MCKVFSFLLFVTLAFAQVGHQINPVTYPDISGASTTTKLATSGSCAALQLIAPVGNNNAIRWGDVNTTSTRGGLLPAGAGQFFPPSANNFYSLSGFYAWVATGDKLTFVCWQQ